jgi:hypothetical protein
VFSDARTDEMTSRETCVSPTRVTLNFLHLHVILVTTNLFEVVDSFFYSRSVHLETIKVFYLSTDAQENCYKMNIEIYIKTALTCFGLITIIRERTIRAC